MIGTIFYVGRCLILSLVFVCLLQIKIKNETLETKVTHWFYQSSLPKHIQAAAAGGALAIENSYTYLREELNQLIGKITHSTADRAGR